MFTSLILETVYDLNVFALKCWNTYCCQKAVQSFFIFCVNLNLACVTQVCSKLKHEDLFMHVKSGAMVASKQTIYGRKDITVVNIMK